MSLGLRCLTISLHRVVRLTIHFYTAKDVWYLSGGT